MVMVVFVAAVLKSNLEGIPKQKIYMRIKENSIPPCWAGPLAFVGKFSSHLGEIRQNHVKFHLGGLAHFSYELYFYKSFLK